MTSREESRRHAIAVWLASAALFALMQTRHYQGDGARWVPTFLAPEAPRPGGGNHFLHPYVGWLIARLTGALGLFQTGSVAWRLEPFLLFNGLCAATGLALLYLFLRRARVSPRAALLGTALAGLSNAFFINATDLTEPAPSVPLMLLGLVLVQGAPESRAARLAAGLCIGLGALIYQTALAALLPACLIVLAQGAPSEPGRERLRRGIPAAAEVAGAAVLLFVGVVLGGSRVARSAHETALLTSGKGVWGRVDPRHLVGGLFGFSDMFAPLHDWAGARQLLAAPPLTVAVNLAAFLLALGLAGCTGLVLWRGLRARGELPRWLNVLGALGWLLGIYLFASWRSPTHAKLWMNGAITFGILLAFALDVEAPRAGIERLARRGMFVIAGLLVLLSLTTGAGPRRFTPDLDLITAEALAKDLGPGDLVVCPGWDSVCVDLATLTSSRARVFHLATEAFDADLSAERTGALLRERVDAALAGGGRVFFLGLLDLGPAEWQVFYGDQLRLPPSFLDAYRAHAQLALSGPAEGTPVKVFRYLSE